MGNPSLETMFKARVGIMRYFILPLMLLMTSFALIIFGCTLNVNDNKPYDAFEAKMNYSSPELLRAVAKGYKKAIVEDLNNIDKYTDECGFPGGKPPTEKQMAKIANCISNKAGKDLLDRLASDIRHLNICVKILEEKGCDTSGLDLKSILNELPEQKMIPPPEYEEELYPESSGIRPT